MLEFVFGEHSLVLVAAGWLSYKGVWIFTGFSTLRDKKFKFRVAVSIFILFISSILIFSIFHNSMCRPLISSGIVTCHKSYTHVYTYKWSVVAEHVTIYHAHTLIVWDHYHLVLGMNYIKCRRMFKKYGWSWRTQVVYIWPKYTQIDQKLCLNSCWAKFKKFEVVSLLDISNFGIMIFSKRLTFCVKFKR